MSNVNINRTGSDPNDNVHYNYTTPKTDYKGITFLIVMIITVLTCIWLILLGVATMICYIDQKYTCTSRTYIFWGYIGLLTCGLIAVLIAAILIVWERMFNMRFLSWRGVLTSREDLRTYAKNIIAVAHASAISEGTAGLDTYSPSNSTNVTAKSDIPVVAKTSALSVDDEDIPLLPISLGDL